MPTPEELEDAAAKEATAGLRRRLADLNRRAAGLATLAQTEDDWLALSGRLADRLERTKTDDIFGPLSKHASAAVEEGVSQARTRLGGGPRRRVMAPLDVIKATANAESQAREELHRAAELMRRARSADDMTAALAAANRSVTRTERTARWSVNRSLSEGVRAVTDEAGVGRMWVPERDACVHCLAYAGRHVKPGEHFPGGLTFGEKALRPGPVADPPLHPNCRCRVVPFLPGDRDYSDALKREARRSILRGWSLPSESERTRLAAADRLLKRGTTLPKSVQDYARRSVRTGHFSMGRRFPDDPKTLRRASTGRALTKKALTPERRSGPKLGDEALAGLPRKTGPLATRTRPALDDLDGQVLGVASGDPERNGDIRFTNPNFDAGVEWQVNCQRVAVAYELRRRGYAVEARPNRKERGDKQYAQHDLEELWREPDGSIRRFVGKRGALGPPAVRGVVQSWPPGARGWIIAQWKTGGAHIWNVEIGADGRPIYLDAQLRRMLPDGEPHFSNTAAVLVMRTDDLLPTEEQKGMVKAAS